MVDKGQGWSRVVKGGQEWSRMVQLLKGANKDEGCFNDALMVDQVYLLLVIQFKNVSRWFQGFSKNASGMRQ